MTIFKPYVNFTGGEIELILRKSHHPTLYVLNALHSTFKACMRYIKQ